MHYSFLNNSEEVGGGGQSGALIPANPNVLPLFRTLAISPSVGKGTVTFQVAQYSRVKPGRGEGGVLTLENPFLAPKR